METWQVFSCMFVMAKNKELFVSTLDRIPISVRCVSSMIVVLNAKFALLLAAHANKKYGENEEARPQCRVFLVETHWRLTFITVFTVRAKTSLLSTFHRSMQANRNTNLWEEKAPVYRLSRSKAHKAQQICHYRHTRKTGELFLFVNTGVDFSLRNNFANAGSFAKVSIPVHIYNSLVESLTLLKLSLLQQVTAHLFISQNLHSAAKAT